MRDPCEGIIGFVQSFELDTTALKTAITLRKSLTEVWIACGPGSDEAPEALPNGIRLYRGEAQPAARMISFYEMRKPDAVFRVPAGCPEDLVSIPAVREMASLFKNEDADLCYNPEVPEAFFHEITAGRAIAWIREKAGKLFRFSRHYFYILHNINGFKVVSTGPEHIRNLRRQVDATYWFHSIDFGNGVKSRGIIQNRPLDVLFEKLDTFKGKRVLDVGMSDGLFSFLAEKKGAREVVGVDMDAYASQDVGFGKSRAIYEHIMRELGPGRDNAPVSASNFALAKSLLNSNVTRRGMTAYEIGPETLGMFDIVLHFGVLYHLLNPMLALEKARNVCGGELYLQTVIDPDKSEKPFMSFTEGGLYIERIGFTDFSHWWTPNLACLKAMLRAAGFGAIEELYLEDTSAILRCR